MVNANDFTILSRSELNKILGAANPPPPGAAARQRLNDRLALKAKSDERVKNWSNTIDGLRAKKRQEREDRLRKEEERRRRLDRDEEAYRQERRRRIIERANRLMLLERDRVKTINSGMLIGEVLEERKKRRRVRRRLARHDTLRARTHHEALLRRCARFDRRERDKCDTRKRETVKLKRMRTRRLDDLMARKRRELADYRAEGTRLAEAAEREHLRAQTEAQRKKEESKRHSKDLMEMNGMLKERKRQERRRLEDEDRAIERYAQEKQRMLDERARRERQRHQAKLQRRRQLIDKRTEILLALRDESEKILLKQEEEVERRYQDRQRSKRQRRDKVRRDIEHQHRFQRALKRRERDEERRRNEDFTQEWAERNVESAIQDAIRRERIRDNAKRTQNYRLSQVELKRRKERQEAESAVLEAKAVKRARMLDELRFRTYVDELQRRNSAMGNEALPLAIAVAKEKKISGGKLAK